MKQTNHLTKASKFSSRDHQPNWHAANVALAMSWAGLRLEATLKIPNLVLVIE